MKKKIIIAFMFVVFLAAWPLSNCMWSGQVVENTAEIPATQKLKSGILETGRDPDISTTQMLPSNAAESVMSAADDSSRGYIDVDESGDFSEGDILLESSGSNDYFLPQDYYSHTET
jgi:hypothetical protein